MKASCSWLRSLVPDLDASPAEIAERFTRAGLEVEEIVEYGSASGDVLLAEVRQVEPHPAKDKLTLVTVEAGRGPERVVCGAPNVPAPGGRVVLARAGTTLPGAGITIEPRAIGGIESAGMLCSEEELGLVAGGGRGAGILVLGADVPALFGTPLAKALPATHDVVLEISVTPNRPDALGHVGLAREVAALFDLPFTAPGADAPSRVAAGLDVTKLASVQIADTDRCPHYGAAVIVDIQVAPSPTWLRYRLESLGVRAISNVVDVTNLVLLELGQPLHAFDLDRLPGGRVVVRRARADETMRTIDHVERRLSDDDLLITDGERPIALAGVMGGADSEIGEGTTRVLLECAYFSPRGIRRTSRRHGLRSEASHRFERGTDPHAVPEVLAQAASLVSRVCRGAAVPGLILAGIAPEPPRRVVLRQPRMRKLLGLDIPLERATRILERLGFTTTRRVDSSHALLHGSGPKGPALSDGSGPKGPELAVEVPSFRPDVKREEDLVEEVMRVHGIDALPATLRAVRPMAGRYRIATEDRVRQVACELGLCEALTYGFVAPETLRVLSAPAPAVTIKNPLSEERSVMRTSLLPGLLEALGRARRHGVTDMRLFAVGRCFLRSTEAGPLPDERTCFAAVLAGVRPGSLGTQREIDVFDAKAVAIEIVERVSGRAAEVERAPVDACPHLHPRGAGVARAGGETVGRFGPLHPGVVDRLDVGGPAMVVEIDIDALSRLGARSPQFRPVPTLPAVSRDLALLVSEDVTAGRLEAAIREAAGALCESVELFDVYSGKGIPAGLRSLAFHLVFRDPNAAADPERARTLTDAEVDERTRRVVEAVNAGLGATVRGG